MEHSEIKELTVVVTCPRCDSKRIVKNGVVRKRQRYLCKECGCAFHLYDRREKEVLGDIETVGALFDILAAPRARRVEELSEEERALLNDFGCAPDTQRAIRDTLKRKGGELQKFFNEKAGFFSTGQPFYGVTGALVNTTDNGGRTEYKVMLVVQVEKLPKQEDKQP